MRTAIVVLASLLAFVGCEKNKAEESETKMEAPTVERTAERDQPAAAAEEAKTKKTEQAPGGPGDQPAEADEEEEELSDDDEE